MGQAQEVAGVRLIAAQVDLPDAARLRELGDTLRERLGSGVVALGCAIGERAHLLVMVTPDRTKQGLHAGKIIRPVAEESVLVLHPLAFASWVGFLVTFVNLIPSWQLDGGHVIRALFGRETHKIISITGVFLLMISGYVIMAVIIAFFLMREGTESMAPLDDVSPTSFTRKLGLVGYAVLMALSLIVLLQA